MNQEVKDLLAKADKEIRRTKRRIKTNNKSLKDLWEGILELDGLELIR